MADPEFLMRRAAGCSAAAGLAFALQRLRPHDRLHRTRWVNVALWAINAVLLSTICGACACAVALLGTPAVAVIVFEVVFTFSNLFEHGNIDLPLGFEQHLAALLVRPALHRRHHARRHPDSNSNFGTIFTWWDRALGT